MILENKKNYGQFYTKRANYIIGNLINDIPENVKLIEPYCGSGDLLILDGDWEIYDIDPKTKDTIQQDTLLNPPCYKNKFVITNPPFLYKNKNNDKTIYDKYNVSDLYKAAIITLLECDGGILILPLNFLCDEDDKIRNIFFESFKILNLNIFEETVFDDTSYTICSFSFIKKDVKDNIMLIPTKIFPSKEEIIIELNSDVSWRIGGEFHKIINNQKNIGISRLVENSKTPNSNIYLRAIDTGTMDGRIDLSLNYNHFYGKNTDRTFATIILDKIYTQDDQQKICEEFNTILESYRLKYNSLFLSNYRNSTKAYSRKRISFDVCYKLISYIINNKL